MCLAVFKLESHETCFVMMLRSSRTLLNVSRRALSTSRDVVLSTSGVTVDGAAHSLESSFVETTDGAF